MAEVIFIFNNIETIIKCNKEDYIKDICQKFISIIKIDINNLNFIYKGGPIDFLLTFNEQINLVDKNTSKMYIYVFKKNNNTNNIIVNESKHNLSILQKTKEFFKKINFKTHKPNKEIKIPSNKNINNKPNNYINNLKLNEISLKYKINEKDNRIKIFDSDFVKNNEHLCFIMHNKKKYKLTEYFTITKKMKKTNILEINLYGINNITNMSYMFRYCSSLLCFPDISNLVTKKVVNISYMFYGCSLLTFLPDISNWDISNIKYMNNLFDECSSLTSLPDISKWDTSNVVNMRYIFYNCS